MRFGSVCSGIEAASVAWHPLGWEAAWLSEIEPFPCAVLKHHYPDVPNYGDMTLLPDRILSGEVEAPDLFCGGTPCQAFSVAGLRNSLDDARGNLSLTFVGIANAIDHVRSVRRDAPAVIFWENVPGVLNTKDNAFGCFLGALAGETEPITAPGDKWTNSGCVFGPQRTVAWRVLDAQYFGVAQRRRRVFVVASARDDLNPAEILFEFEGVRRDIAPSRQARQEVAGTIAARFGISRNNIEECVSVVGALDTECGGNKMNHQTINSGHLLPVKSFYESSLAQYREANVSGTIKASGGVAGGGSETFLAQPAYAIQGSMIGRSDGAGPQGDGINVEVCFTQNCVDRHAVAQPIAVYENHPSDSRVTELGDVSSTVRARWGTGGGNLPMVSQPIAFEPGKMKRLGYGDAEPGLAPSLRAQAGDNQLAVAQPIAFHPTQDPITSTDGTTHGLGCGSSGGQASIAVAQPIGVDMFNATFSGDVAVPLTHRSDGTGTGPTVMTPVCLGGQHPNAGIGIDQTPTLTSAMGMGGGHVPITSADVAPTLTASNDPSRSPQSTEVTNQVAAIHAVSMAVRRLTPVECERLQGFPDNYTNIPWRKAAESPDGPRYKALGNSWAVPVVAWIGQRIQERITT